jgi:hypothetical protein
MLLTHTAGQQAWDRAVPNKKCHEQGKKRMAHLDRISAF